MEVKKLFTELNDDNALSIFLSSDEEFINTVEAGSKWINNESAMASQFAMAANLLRESAINSGTPWFYTHPILYLYRHALELYLKGILRPSKPTHNLLLLRDKLIEHAKLKWDVDIADSWVAQTISEFATIDPNSTRFRYAKDNNGQQNFAAEQIVNLKDLKHRMDKLFQALMPLAIEASSFCVVK